MTSIERHPALPTQAEAAEFNLRLLWTLSRYLKEKYGEPALAAVASAAELPSSAFEDHTRWVSFEQFETILAAARGHFTSDEEFVRANEYRMAEVYGPFRFIGWATSPALVYRATEKANRFCSTVGGFKVIETDATHARIRWTSSKHESRLMCMSRSAQAAVAPTLWGLPPAKVIEHSCIAKGDDCCEYSFEWAPPRHIARAIVLGIVTTGTLLALRVPYVGWVNALLAGVAVSALAMVVELTGRLRHEGRLQVEAAEALQKLVTEEAEARRELFELNKRQAQWSRLIEDEAHTRAERAQAVVDALTTTHQERTTHIRGVSHDLKSPLTVIVTNVHVLRENENVDPEILDELEHAAGRMTALASALVEGATETRELKTKRLDTKSLSDALGRRLRALVFGRQIRTTTFQTRYCPPHIDVDPIILDRIMDNLLSNAAKYTAQGSILCELGDGPDALVIKLSDTGRGIAQDDIERIFHAGGSTVSTRAANSHGVGLSVVLQLLERIGGRLEVMSELEKGTTFWIHIPVSPDVARRPNQAPHSLLTIRRAAS